MLNSVQTSQTPVPTRIPTRAHTHACGDGHLGLYGRLQREQPMARRVLLGPREAVSKPRGTPVTSRLHHGSSPLSPQGEAIANPRSRDMRLCPWGPCSQPRHSAFRVRLRTWDALSLWPFPCPQTGPFHTRHATRRVLPQSGFYAESCDGSSDLKSVCVCVYFFKESAREENSPTL